jgi:glutamate--cysteine ligase
MWTGILYDERSLGEAEALVDGWTHDEVAELRTRVWREGLRANFRGKPFTEVAERVVAIADGGLQRRAIPDPRSRKDERVHLERIRTLVGQGKTPADVLLEGMGRVKDQALAIVERASLKWR